jgi:hypothetical protein
LLPLSSLKRTIMPKGGLVGKVILDGIISRLLIGVLESSMRKG